MKQKDYKQSVDVAIGPDVTLNGILQIPDGAKRLVLFAHGSGSSRHSPRNQFVAETLNEAGIATLLFDLLTEAEEKIDARTRSYRFDIQLLGERVSAVIDWLKEQYLTENLSIGLFGASTGAAAALVAAANRTEMVHAVVSRGGRPDLAADALPHVTAPTLLIVGGKDETVIEYNQQAMTRLNVTKSIEIVPGANHLFEEQGKLREVATLAKSWFTEHLPESVRTEDNTLNA